MSRKSKNSAVAAVASAAASIFGSKTAPPRKGAKKEPTEEVELPKPLRRIADIYAAGSAAEEALKNRVKVCKNILKKHMVRWWCQRFAETKTRPRMVKFLGERGSVAFVQTERITLTAEKQEMLAAMGVDLSDYIETTGVTLDLSAIKSMGLEEKLIQLLDKVLTPEQMSQVLTPIVQTKEGILDALPYLATSIQGEGSLSEKMERLIHTLDAGSQHRQPSIVFSEDRQENLKECFSFAANEDIPAT